MLKELSDAILEFVMNLTGNGSRPTKGSSAEAVENIRKNIVTRDDKKREPKDYIQKKIDKNTLKVVPGIKIINMLGTLNEISIQKFKASAGILNLPTLIQQAI